MAGIQHLAHDIASTPELTEDQSVVKGLDELQSDLARLKLALGNLKGRNVGKSSMDGVEVSLPSLLGGMALGVVLGKFLGSKLQLDLLPFLVGLELVTGSSQDQTLL